jgi:hypothetical protein
MGETRDNKPPARDWRFALTIGLAIGVGLGIARGVTQGLESDLGHWWAILLGVVASAVGGGLAALLAHWVLHRGK